MTPITAGDLDPAREVHLLSRSNRVTSKCKVHLTDDCPRLQHATGESRSATAGALFSDQQICKMCNGTASLPGRDLPDVPAIEDHDDEIATDGGQIQGTERYHVVCHDCEFEAVSSDAGAVQKGAEIHEAAFDHDVSWEAL